MVASEGVCPISATATIYPCASTGCDALYEQQGRRASYYCPACREARHDAARVAWDAGSRQRRDDLARELDEIYADKLISPALYREARKALGSLRPPERREDDNFEYAPLPPLADEWAPCGPDVGTSTAKRELADTLYGEHPHGNSRGVGGLAAAANDHLWWAANPNAFEADRRGEVAPHPRERSYLSVA